MADGPFPEHYEPWESPVINPLHTQETNPALWDMEQDAKGATHAFPLVGTTYRVSEHWQTGAMTRNLPWLVEMQPEMFVEMSPQLAEERGIANGEHVMVESARGAIEAVAVVTPRFQPFIIHEQVVHEIGMPYHWGYIGPGDGRQRQRADAAGGRRQHHDPRDQGVPVQRAQARQAGKEV